ELRRLVHVFPLLGYYDPQIPGLNSAERVGIGFAGEQGREWRGKAYFFLGGAGWQGEGGGWPPCCPWGRPPAEFVSFSGRPRTTLGAPATEPRFHLGTRRYAWRSVLPAA